MNDGTVNAFLCNARLRQGDKQSHPGTPAVASTAAGADPAIVFDQSTRVGATAYCANGTAVGDTHLTNFNGLLFDFQASGDFLLAEIDPDFVVQTRQKSGAPTWPNASVNKAVGMKMGKTRVAICLEPNRFVVDGKPNNIGNGKSLSLPDVTVTRNGDVYVFTRPDGANVRAELNNGWIDVSVSLGGPAPVVNVRGLLGNANGNTGPDDLAARDGRCWINNRFLLETFIIPSATAGASHPTSPCCRNSAAIRNLNAPFRKSCFTRTTSIRRYMSVRERIARQPA